VALITGGTSRLHRFSYQS